MSLSSSVVANGVHSLRSRRSRFHTGIVLIVTNQTSAFFRLPKAHPYPPRPWPVGENGFDSHAA